MKIDLHIHTTASDGELTPVEVLKKYQAENFDIVAITDHDTVSGAKEVLNYNVEKKLTVIPGIELGAKYIGGELHILGYNIDVFNKALNDVCTLIKQDNVYRIRSLIANLREYYGFKFSDSDIENLFTNKTNIRRPDIARLCVKYGYATTVKEAFDKYMEPIRSKTVKKKIDLTPRECIEYILKANGVPCIAHPISLQKDMDELESYLKELKSYGAMAIEVYHSKHSKEYANNLLKIAKKLNLLVSAGSDFHGEIVKPNVFLGKYNNDNLDVTDISILSKIAR